MIHSPSAPPISKSKNHTPTAFVQMVEVEPGVFTLPPVFSAARSLYLSSEFREFSGYVQSRGDIVVYFWRAVQGMWTVGAADEEVTSQIEGHASTRSRRIARSFIDNPGVLEALLMIADQKTVTIQSLSQEVGSYDVALKSVTDLSKNGLVKVSIDGISLTGLGASVANKVRILAQGNGSDGKI